MPLQYNALTMPPQCHLPCFGHTRTQVIRRWRQPPKIAHAQPGNLIWPSSLCAMELAELLQGRLQRPVRTCTCIPLRTTAGIGELGALLCLIHYRTNMDLGEKYTHMRTLQVRPVASTTSAVNARHHLKTLHAGYTKPPLQTTIPSKHIRTIYSVTRSILPTWTFWTIIRMIGLITDEKQ